MRLTLDSSIVSLSLCRCIFMCPTMGVTTIHSGDSLYTSSMLSTFTLSSTISSSMTSSPTILNLKSEPTMSFHLLPLRVEPSQQPSIVSIAITGNSAPTHRPSPMPQPPAQRQQQQGVQAMTFGGAIYTTVLASLGMGICLSSLHASLNLTSYSCFQSSSYGCHNTFKTGI